MKLIIAFMMTSLLSASALAGQSVNCRQINKSGSIKAKGLQLTLTMTSKKSGEAQVKGFRKGSELSELDVRGLNEGTAIDDSQYTTIFLLPKNDDGMLDIQLQFDQIVLGKNFSGVKANFVIGSDSANPENYFAYGYDMVCSGKTK